MLEELKEQLDTSIKPLIRGIVEDTQNLVRNEFALVKSELKEDLRNVKAASQWMFFGAVSLAVSLAFLAIAAVYGLTDAFPELPLWGAYLIMTLLLGGIGAFALMRGSERISEVKVIPEDTIQSIREGLT